MLKILPNFLLNKLSPLFFELIIRGKAIKQTGRKHSLPQELIVSLTSYPARFGKLHLTLKSLLSQSIRPNRLILWVAHEDRTFLPLAVTKLQRFGLEIKYCKDLRSYKKIIPALRLYPDAFITTADDDTYYRHSWLEELVACYDPVIPTSVCHRARLITFDDQTKELLPYSKWTLISNQDKQNLAHPQLIFPTGIGGVLYPPNSLHELATSENQFSRFCNDADDVWLYWMVRKNGWTSKIVPKIKPFFEWRGSENNALYQRNLACNENDASIQKMAEIHPIEF